MALRKNVCCAFFCLCGVLASLDDASLTRCAIYWVIHRLELVCPGRFAGHRDPEQQAFHAQHRHPISLCDLRPGRVAVHTRLAF